MLLFRYATYILRGEILFPFGRGGEGGTMCLQINFDSSDQILLFRFLLLFYFLSLCSSSVIFLFLILIFCYIHEFIHTPPTPSYLPYVGGRDNLLFTTHVETPFEKGGGGVGQGEQSNPIQVPACERFNHHRHRPESYWGLSHLNLNRERDKSAWGTNLRGHGDDDDPSAPQIWCNMVLRTPSV